MTNKPRGTLYVGVTANLAARVDQPRQGTGSAFCRKYNATRLVLAEQHDKIDQAIAREKAFKSWQRDWKIRLIEEAPDWQDVFDQIA